MHLGIPTGNKVDETQNYKWMHQGSSAQSWAALLVLCYCYVLLPFVKGRSGGDCPLEELVGLSHNLF